MVVVLGACVVAGGHAWQLGERAWQPEGAIVARVACVVARGGVHGIRRDMVNEQAVHILLECILVILEFLILGIGF